MLTGTVRLDLSDAAPERMRHRLNCLPEVPSGARVIVVVGAMRVEPEAARLLALHERRLHIELQGMPSAVARWLAFVREPNEVLT